MKIKARHVIPACMVLTAILLTGILSMSLLTDKHGSTATEVQEQSLISDTYIENSSEAIKSEGEVEADSGQPSDFYVELLNEEGFYETGDSGYALSPDERRIVECAVMCEAGGEGLKGEMMVAQSILDGTLRNGFDVIQSIKAYDVATTSYSYVTDEVREAVSRVFDDGQRVTMEKTDLWYNPGLVMSLWHEEQQYVTTVGNHRFFWMNQDM